MKKIIILIVALLLLAVSQVDAQALRVFISAQVGSNPISGYVLTTDGTNSSWQPAGGGGSSKWNDNGTTLTPTANESIVVNGTSSLQNLITANIQASTSAGLVLSANNGTRVADFGAGGGSNATFLGGVNIDGQTRIATNLTGVLRADAGVISTTSVSGSGGSNWSILSGGLRTSTSTDFAQAAFFVASSTTATSTFAGGVGIGTTTPTTTLTVAGASTFIATSTTAVTVAGGNGSPVFVVDTSTTPTSAYRTTLGRASMAFSGTGINFSISNQTSGSLSAVINNGQGRDILMQSSGVDALVMQGSTRNIGIGTSSPSTRLTVSGDMRLTGRFTDSSSSTGAVGSVLTATATGTQWLATSTLNIIGGSGLADPLTTDGDIIARISGVTTRLAQGTNGQFLGVSGGLLGYYTPAGGSGGSNWSILSGGLRTSTSTDFAQAAYFIASSTTGTSTFAGRLGISTTSPSYPLSVNGDSGFTGQLNLIGSVANIALGTNFLSGDGGDEGITIDSSGNVAMGTTTDSNDGLRVQSNLLGGFIANFFDSRGSTTLSVFSATTTPQHGTGFAGFLQSSLARVSIGIERLLGYFGSGRFFGSLTINGLFFQQDWYQVNCPGSTLTSGAVSLSADGLTGCSGISFYEDNTATAIVLGTTVPAFTRMQISTANDGSGFFLNGPGAGQLRIATSTPVMEATARIVNLGNVGTTTQFYIGFSNIGAGGTTYETAPTAGCFFTSSTTQANWLAVCRTTATAQTIVDTGVASSTGNASVSGLPYRFLIETGNNYAGFFLQSSQAEALTNVATITTNVPNDIQLNAGVHMGRNSGTTTISMDIYDMNIGWRKVLAN